MIPVDSTPLPSINDGRRPSRLDLARMATGETPLTSTDPWLAALEAERARVEPFDFEVLRARSERLEDPPSPVRRGFRWAGPWLALAAFAAFGGLLAVQMAGQEAALSPSGHSSVAEEGVKGPPSAGVPTKTVKGKSTLDAVTTPTAGSVATSQAEVAHLQVLVDRGGKVYKGKFDTEVQAGDLVGFRSFSAVYDRVTLAFVSESGVVTALDGTSGLTAIPLHTQERQDLDVHFAVTPPVSVVVVAFFGEWTPDSIRASVAQAWAGGGVDALDELADDHDDIEVVVLHTP